MNKINQIIAQTIFTMKQKGITQVELCEQLKISRPTISNALKGKNVNLDILKKIIDYIENK